MILAAMFWGTKDLFTSGDNAFNGVAIIFLVCFGFIHVFFGLVAHLLELVGEAVAGDVGLAGRAVITEDNIVETIDVIS